MREATPRGVPTESATEKIPPFGISNLKFQKVRVKRRGKSPPLQAQARRHGKPHRVQGQIGDRGAARSMPRVGQASRLSREEKTGWKPVPLCGQVPGTGCSDKWFSPQLLRARVGQTEFGLQPFQNQRIRPVANRRIFPHRFVQSRFTARWRPNCGLQRLSAGLT